jgi:hypothetical protein
MTITLPEPLVEALRTRAEADNVSVEDMVLRTLNNCFMPIPWVEPRDEWERQLLAIGRDAGSSPSDAALSREGLYDE